ncbi:MAG TPA: spherulation-specific family 4 protein [Acidimicrobiales bacterium]|nr:spherulation-specific family 4 protein [Acidimicrobiales bacterium]
MLLRAAVVVVAATVIVLLVTTRRTDDAEHTSCTRLAVPAYVEPAELVRAGDDEATTVVILNPADGPDVERDEELVPAVRAVRGDGVLVLGYVATGYGAISVDEVVAQARRYERWYGVDGIFLDEVSSEAADLAHYDGMTASLRADGMSTVAINPGVYPDRGYLDVADLVVTFEGTAQEYLELERPAEIGAFAGEWHLVHTASRREALDAVALAARRGVPYFYATDRAGAGDTWNALPPWFAAQSEAALATC